MVEKSVVQFSAHLVFQGVPCGMKPSHMKSGKGKGKVALSLCFNWSPRHEGVVGEWVYSSANSLTSALDGGEQLASRPGRFTPIVRAQNTHWIGGWVDPSWRLFIAITNSLCRRSIGDSLPCVDIFFLSVYVNTHSIEERFNQKLSIVTVTDPDPTFTKNKTFNKVRKENRGTEREGKVGERRRMRGKNIFLFCLVRTCNI
jgi:hypothetical protein